MLFNNTRKKARGHGHRVSHLHYGNAKKARQTIRYLRRRPRAEQVRGAQTMYFRAKYHAKQTPDMRDAMKVYSKYLKALHV